MGYRICQRGDTASTARLWFIPGLILEGVSDRALPAVSRVIADVQVWVDRFRLALDLALAQFLGSAE
jgi:hypothetical protein